MADVNAKFDGSIPEMYDRHLGSVLFEPYAMDLVQRLALHDGVQVLELACGTGIVTHHLRRRLPPRARIVATDLNEPMLAYARSKFDHDAAIEWRQADATALPFPAATFNVVICQFGLMFFPDKSAAVREVVRVLRPGGMFAFNVWDTMAYNDLARIAHETITQFFPVDPPDFYKVPFSFCQPAEIQSLLANTGFTDVQLEVVSLEARSPSAHHAAIGIVQGNPTVTAIRERGGVEVSTIVDAIAEAVAHQCGAAPMRAPMRALVVTARAGPN